MSLHAHLVAPGVADSSVGKTTWLSTLEECTWKEFDLYAGLKDIVMGRVCVESNLKAFIHWCYWETWGENGILVVSGNNAWAECLMIITGLFLETFEVLEMREIDLRDSNSLCPQSVIYNYVLNSKSNAWSIFRRRKIAPTLQPVARYLPSGLKRTEETVPWWTRWWT